MRSIITYLISIAFISLFIYSSIEITKQYKIDSKYTFSDTIIINNTSYECENGTIINIKLTTNFTGYYLTGKVIFNPFGPISSIDKKRFILPILCQGTNKSLVDECSKQYIEQKNGIICWRNIDPINDVYIVHSIYDYVEKPLELSIRIKKLIALSVISAFGLIIISVILCVFNCSSKKESNFVPTAPTFV